MLATMCPDIVFARLPVILTCGIVTALLGFILIKIEFHSHPLSVGSHAKKGIGYPMRVLISIVPSYTTEFSLLLDSWGAAEGQQTSNSTKESSKSASFYPSTNSDKLSEPRYQKKTSTGRKYNVVSEGYF